jgi:predicted RecB family nuclease
MRPDSQKIAGAGAAMAPVRLSKSKFTAGVQCPKRLYFQIYRPDLAGAPDDEQEARIDQGNAVGLIARTAFPGGVLVVPELDLESALLRTERLLADPTVPAIFEATFRHSEVLVRVDILQRTGRGRWRLIEAKSSVEPKEHYLYDVAIQYHVVSNCGVDIRSAELMHLNRDYVYAGGPHDPSRLFTTRDLTRQARKLCEEVAAELRAQRRMLARPQPPAIDPGPQCIDPYPCEFFGHCNPEPPKHHVSFLPRLSESKRQNLFDLGIEIIQDIPEDFPLTELQSRVAETVRTRRIWTSDALGSELKTIGWPMYFMDFESVFPAIPRHAGMWPYAHLPFQWSVHRQEGPEAPLVHSEFLAIDDRDRRGEFIGSLCETLGRRGPIVVYNSGFESQRLRDLAVWFPEYAARIGRINARLWDLLAFVRHHVYHPDFHGSFSLKQVLPALVPELSYSGMEVAHGGQAGLAWERMTRGEVDEEERQRLRSALLAYCRQDTLAMVKLLERLRSLGG